MAFIEFTSALPFVNRSNNNPVVTSLNIINSDPVLLIGSDRRLFGVDGDRIWLQYEQQNSVIPSFYVDGELQTIGFYYNNGGAFHNVSFDEKLDYNTTVEVSNKYDIYIAEYEGWVEQKYDAEFNIYSNEVKIGESTNEIEIDTTEFTNFQFPVYDDTTSNKLTADIYKTQIETDIGILSGNDVPEGDNLRDTVTRIFNNINRFKSQLYESVKIIDITDNGTTITVPMKYPSIDVKGWEPAVLTSAGEMKYQNIVSGIRIFSDDQQVSIGTADVSTGMFIFDNIYDKYDVLTLDIIGCTVKNIGENSHREVEDVFEEFNSGFPSALSKIQQANIIKLGLFNEKEWPDRQNDLSSAFQANYIIPRDNDFYDTLNSTVNYIEQVYDKDIILSLSYPSSVLFVSEINKIFIGGAKGVLTIKVETLDIEELVIGDLSNEVVKQVVKNDSNLYVLTNKNIYKSEDYGTNWSKLDKSGLSKDLYSIGFVLNNIVVGGSDGLYYKSADDVNWDKSNIQTTDSVIVYPITVISSLDLLFAYVTTEEDGVIKKDIYSTVDGYHFDKMDVVDNFEVSKIVKFGNTIYIATNDSLYVDIDVNRGSFYGDNPRLVQVIMGNNPEEDNVINDIFVDNSNERMYVAMGNGTYYVLEDGVFDLREYTSLSAIHKILVIDDNVWLFGYNLVQIPYSNYPIRL